MMALKTSLELIHICATHASAEVRRAAILEYLSRHPEIDRNELLTMMPEMPVA
ncbi:hypothetical protein [Methanoregula boonei]|jgi:hypothetical protein|uniref:hypothetical protein n=1 Tax=Methanoregula boonei TaxID=358766 RepID=UPI0012FA8058|nr:hypothetical protein [Methanoregula boonei]